MPRTATRSTPLDRYAAKRNFGVTPEPEAVQAAPAEQRSFVIQKHWATRLHYDFRLELDGVLLSWAVPKGPSFDPQDKRMAIHVEDHPVSYGGFEGTIPPKQYGAGKVIVWDRGLWEPVGDPHEGLAQGKLVFRLHGEKLAGLWELVRIKKPDDRQDPWILFKKRDAWARPHDEYDVIAALPDSVIAKPLGPVEGRDPREARAAGNGGDGALAAGADAGPSAPDELPGAEKAALPASLSPQLATLAAGTPSGGRWIYEVKFDGYRLLARIDGKQVKLFTRNGHDWTSKMTKLAEAIGKLGLHSAWLDGEIVVRNKDGIPDFNALQNAFDNSRTEKIDYFLFDLPYLEGYDLRSSPLEARRALLQQIVEVAGDARLRFSAGFDADPAHMLETARQLKIEGIIAKRADAPYVSRRADSWLKLKWSHRQEFVIAGFTDRAGSRAEVGSLLLAYYDDHRTLIHAGNVGTGWDTKTSSDLRKRLDKIEIETCPFPAGPTAPGRWTNRTGVVERWVKPELVCEVSFAEWTPDGHVRQAKFIALRDDKPASAIRREQPTALPGAATAAAPRRAASNATKTSVKVTHPERVIDPSTGLKKLDLVRYYEAIADWILPHLKGRPVSLVRAPSGITGQIFFQKHDDKLSIPGLRELDAALWPGHAALLEVPTAKALVNAAQMNVIEFHTWNSSARRINEPDRLVFDLDPGEGVKWPQVQEAAQLMHTLLDELGLAAWLKTSGGKGLHVVVPITPKLDYDTVKDFSEAVVQHLARTIPSRFVAKSGASNRVGKIFVDYLRNGFGATTAVAFSARARPGLGVSMPVAWEQLPSLKSGSQWTITTAREYLSFQGSDPWADYWRKKQTLTGAMKKLGFEPVGKR